MPNNRSLSNWSIVYITTGISIVCFALVTLGLGFNEESLRLNIRWSARFSVVCFCLAFSASAVNLVFKNSFTKWIVLNRKYFGISFAVIHLIHLLFLILLHLNFHRLFIWPSIVELTLGGMAYVFLLLMLITSFDVFSKQLSNSNWNRLHTIGGYWILIVFSNSFLGSVIAGKFAYFPLAILVLAVWGIRFLSWRKKKTISLMK